MDAVKINPFYIAGVVALYFLVLTIIGRLTARKGDNKTFFVANRTSPWYLVAFGMIGTTISGVTFISVPGEVGVNYFSYMQIVFGYFFGYLVIAFVLLPLYYRLQLTSIYTYLNGRYGKSTYRTGSFFFLLSRTIGSSLRLFLAVNVFQIFIFDHIPFFGETGIPFSVSVIISVILVLLYSAEGGMKTIIWTDTLQTVFFIAALIITIFFINDSLGWSLADSARNIGESVYSKTFFWDPNDKNFFLKQFFSGMFITIAMTGLDQEMMQKNLTCRSLKDAQKNMLSFSAVLIFVNLLFLALGALFYIYAESKGVTLPANPETGRIITDRVFPTLALEYFPQIFQFIFIIGLTAAAFGGADSALAALTTAFCVDFLGFKEDDLSAKRKRQRYRVHIAFAVITVLAILVFHALNDQSVISTLFKIAGYTYGPLLGLYTFGLFSKRTVRDSYIPAICVGAPLVTYFVELLVSHQWPDYKIGFENLMFTGFLVYASLYLASEKNSKVRAENL